jgi:hemoglobin
MTRPTLYEHAGGAAGMLRLARAHHAGCLADPELSHAFSHGDQHPQHVERLAAYWGEVFGGPPAYSRTGGNQSALLVMHAGNGDMTDLGRRFVDCFVKAASTAELPADPPFRAALRAYMEEAVQPFTAYPEMDPVVPPGLPIPRWGWDGPEVGDRRGP